MNLQFPTIGIFTGKPNYNMRLAHRIALPRLALLFLAPSLLDGKTITYTEINPPLSIATHVKTVDGNGDVAGIFATDTTSPSQGFLLSGVKESYSTFAPLNTDPNVPVYLTGISGVTRYVDNLGHTCILTAGQSATKYSTGPSYHAFFNTTSPNAIPINQFDVQGAVNWNQVGGVSGTMIFGNYYDSLTNTRAFLYDINTAKITKIDPPGSTNSSIVCMSGTRSVVYWYSNTNPGGYDLYENGKFTPILVGPPDTYPAGSWQIFGISGNNRTGNYTDTSGISHAYFYNGSSFTKIDPPGAASSTFVPCGISGGSVAGTYQDATTFRTHGVVYNYGEFIVIDPPQSIGTTLVAISGRYVVGTYTDSNNVGHQFRATLPASANVTLGGLATTYNGTVQKVAVTTTPAALTYSITYNGITKAPTNAGSYNIVVKVTNPNYVAGASGTLVIAKAAQTITFPQITNKILGAAPFTLNATASSKLKVTYTATGPATVSGSTVTIKNIGTVQITAHQPGNGNYKAAPNLMRSFTVAP